MKETPVNAPIPPRVRSGLPWRFSLILAVISLAVMGATVLFLFDPAKHGFYPICLFKRMTGYDCPGCGGLRAVHQLLHGDLWKAFQLNALAVVGLPVFAVWAVWAGLAPLRPSGSQKRPGLLWAWILVALILLFGVIRNLSLWPFGVTPM